VAKKNMPKYSVVLKIKITLSLKMKLLTSERTRAWDAYTIEHEPISSINLMERASMVFTDWFLTQFNSENTVYIFCGTGNNGGDGLAIARLLHHSFFNVKIFICTLSNAESDDFKINLSRLPGRAEILMGYLHEGDIFPMIEKEAIIIDAILGSGLSRPVTGYWASFFEYLNETHNDIVSVDIPSGLFSDKTLRNTEPAFSGVAIEAKHVFSFETPKLSFLIPENQHFIQSFYFKTIGLKQDFLDTIESNNIYITHNFIKNLCKKRDKFSHKGTHGHALLVVGSFGMAGAAVLAARACMRSGVGLLTVHTPQCNRLILQTSIPEAMVRTDADEFAISQNNDSIIYEAIGIGCGIGKAGRTASALKIYLSQTTKPMVIDADALNLIADNPEMLLVIPKHSILTPHPKEFERLFGKTKDDFERLELLRNKAKSLKINILLKGAHTIVANTEGVCFFNSTGNAGMATAGSGDVLTGIITGLLAQDYEPTNAAILGVYLHGLAGDLAAEKIGQEALIASDIIEHLGFAFKNLTAKLQN
jgi:ADP-dependent NAD(P)H-hydrate dehydratase / NAD(P)H-hydrate epimerase